jgi:hypothetical protein
MINIIFHMMTILPVRFKMPAVASRLVARIPDAACRGRVAGEGPAIHSFESLTGTARR